MKINPETGCHEWIGTINKDGYGLFRYQRRTLCAHKVAWHMAHGEWPTNVLDHLCKVRHCVNIEHMEPVTQLENINRSTNKAARKDPTKCASGKHEWIEENLVHSTATTVACKLCHNENTRARRARMKEWTQEKAQQVTGNKSVVERTMT